MPNNRRYRNRSSICLTEVAEEGFVSLLGSREFRYICDRFCQHAGFTPKIIFESDNPSAVKNMIEDPVCQRDIIISHNRNKTDSRNVVDFYDFLTGFFEERKRNTKQQYERTILL